MAEKKKKQEITRKNKFLKVKCEGCGNEQIIFSAPSKNPKCLVCGQELGKSTGHKIVLTSKKIGEIE